jgi:hypothetical protein
MSAGRRVFLKAHWVFFVFGVGGLAFFYQELLVSGFARMPGDTGDARHINLVLEHWFRVFSGEAAWRSPNFFFPQAATLGYSEALFLCALPYSLLRLLGAGMHSAFQGVLIWLSAVGYTAMYVLLCRTFGCQKLVAALVASLFAFSNQLTTHMGHPHLVTTAFVPVIAYCGFTYADPRDAHRWALVHGLAGSMLMALFLYTCFNIAWFVMFFAIVLSMVWLGLGWLGGERPRWIVAEVWRRRRDGLLLVLAFVVGLIPFVATYVPVWRDLGGRSFRDVVQMIPSPLDLINVGGSNRVWGGVMAAVTPRDRGAISGLFTLGSPLFFMACFLCFGLGAITRLVRTVEKPEFRDRTAASLAGAVFISWILLVKVKGHSLWWVVFHFVPGASAIRVVNRYQLVLYAAMCIVVAIGLRGMLEGQRRSRWVSGGVAVAAVLLLGEQANHMQTFDKVSETDRLARVQSPPAACRVFFADHRPSMDRPFYAFQTDAAMVARVMGVPTINGYSSNFPKGWDLLFHTSPGYSSGVADWVLSHGLENGLCSLDLERGSWQLIETVAVPDAREGDPVKDLPSSVAEALRRRGRVRVEGS